MPHAAVGASAVGVAVLGVIARGEVGLIFASVGHTVMVAGVPVLNDGVYSAIVAMVMLTTLATPPLLKAAFTTPSGPRSASSSESPG